MTTYAPDAYPEIEPDVVHWQPTHRKLSEQPALILTPTALAAIGAFALGAVAVGAIAVGAMAIGRLDIGRARFRVLDVDQLNIGALRRLEA